ncbi:MAG: hypothetical protein KDB94_10295 [Acidobacteria bacterium]|nr:hypothetical protein [Acidobacteriota bacterium]
MAPASDPRLPLAVRLLTVAEVLVLAGASGFLLFAPALVQQVWPWALTPFNTRFLGAVYASAMIPVAAVLAFGRRRAARPGVLGIFLFTFVVLLVSFAYRERFDSERWATAVWWALYVILPLSSGSQLLLGRRDQAPAGGAVGALRAHQALAWLQMLYGAALLVRPSLAGSFWPWPLDDFHGRLYSAAFLTGGVGALSVLRRGERRWLRVSGIGQAAFGLLALGGLLVVDRAVHKVAWSAPGTWLWLGAFALLALGGAALALSGRKNR